MHRWRLPPDECDLARWVTTAAVAGPLAELLWLAIALLAAASPLAPARAPWLALLSPWVPLVRAETGVVLVVGASPILAVLAGLLPLAASDGGVGAGALRPREVALATALVAAVDGLLHAALAVGYRSSPLLRRAGLVVPVALVAVAIYLLLARKLVELETDEGEAVAPGDFLQPHVLVAAGILAILAAIAIVLSGVVLLLPLLLYVLLDRDPAALPYLTLATFATYLLARAALWLRAPRAVDPDDGTVTVGALTVPAGDVRRVRRLAVGDATLLACSLAADATRSWVVVPVRTVDELAVHRVLPRSVAVSPAFGGATVARLRRAGALGGGALAVAVGAALALPLVGVAPEAIPALAPVWTHLPGGGDGGAFLLAGPLALVGLKLLDVGRDAEE